MIVFQGPNAELELDQATEGKRCVSPGGAAQYLKTSRAYIHELIKLGKVQCWCVRKGIRLTEMHVSILELADFAVRIGRFKEVHDQGSFALSREEFQDIVEKYQALRLPI